MHKDFPCFFTKSQIAGWGVIVLVNFLGKVLVLENVDSVKMSFIKQFNFPTIYIFRIIDICKDFQFKAFKSNIQKNIMEQQNNLDSKNMQSKLKEVMQIATEIEKKSRPLSK